MKKRDALRLRSGQMITFGNHQLTAKSTETAVGHVVRVTANGGILVRVSEGAKIAGGSWDWSGPGTGHDAGAERWVPYHHVIQAHQ